AIEQLSFEAAVALNLEHDLDARMALFKFLDCLRKERSRGNWRAADGEPAFSEPVDFVDFVGCSVDHRDRVAGAAHQNGALGGQRDFDAVPFEKLVFKLVDEALYERGTRRLSQAERLRRLGKAVHFRDFYENPKLMKRHREKASRYTTDPL